MRRAMRHAHLLGAKDPLMHRLVPALGKLLPGGAAYAYLPASVRRFPDPRELAALCADAGFGQIRWRLLGGGIVALHTATAVSEARRPGGL